MTGRRESLLSRCPLGWNAGRAVGWASSLEGRAFKSRVLCRKPVTSVLRKTKGDQHRVDQELCKRNFS